MITKTKKPKVRISLKIDKPTPKSEEDKVTEAAVKQLREKSQSQLAVEVYTVRLARTDKQISCMRRMQARLTAEIQASEGERAFYKSKIAAAKAVLNRVSQLVFIQRKNGRIDVRPATTKKVSK